MPEIQVPRQRQIQVVMRQETQPGVDVLAGTYTANDIVPVDTDSVRWRHDDNNVENRMTSGHLGRLASVKSAVTAQLDFSMFIRGRGSAYSGTNRPEASLPLRACGLAETITTTAGSENVAYQPTDNRDTFTIYLVINVPGGNARALRMVGCQGTVAFAARAGGVLRADFTFRGSMSDTQTDISYVAGSLAPTPSFPTFRSAAFQIGATNYAPRAVNMTFAVNNDIQPVDAINAASGVAGFAIMDRAPIVTIDPEADRESNFSWWTRLRDGAPLDDLSFQVGTVQYNRIKFNFGAGLEASVQLRSLGLGFRNGIVSLPVELLATIASPNSDFRIVFD